VESPLAGVFTAKGQCRLVPDYMIQGRRHVERIPRAVAEKGRAPVAAGRELQDAVKEVLAANVQLLVLAKNSKRTRGKKRKK